MNVPKDYEDFFALLNKNKALYVIVGAYALAYHGAPRFTGDLDIFIPRTEENIQKVLKTLDDYGFRELKIGVQDLIKPDLIIQLGYEPLRIDLITSIDGVSFEEAWDNRIEDKFGNETVYYISKEDLIKNKKATGRPKDLNDLELLA